MQFASILSPARSCPRAAFPTFLLSLAIVATAWLQPARAQNGSDDVIMQMKQAAQRGDKARLSALLPQARGHLLEPWAAYWELKARLGEASPSEVQDFLSRYAGTYQEDRLRNDWLILLGQRRDWDGFAALHPAYRMNDDAQVRCYAVLVEALRSGTPTPEQAAEVRRNWLSQRELDDGCLTAADRMISARMMSPNDAWKKARLAIETNRPQAARAAVLLAAPDAVRTSTSSMPVWRSSWPAAALPPARRGASWWCWR
jgi:soluble lytic murein transglycosylase